MASRKASGITWNISVNAAGARTQISLLKRQVREANREWRNQSNSLMAAGRYTDALKVKEKGLLHVQGLLRSAIGKTDTMLNNSSQDSGTRKYQQTAVDVKNFKDQLTKTGTQLGNVNRKMELHNSTLENTSRRERDAQDVERSRIEQLRAEGRETKANTEQSKSYQHQLELLTQREAALHSTINEARNNGLNHPGNSDYTHLISQLNKVRQAEADVRNEQTDFDSGLTNGTKYNDLYNQSTNKLIASLNHLKQHTEANRIEYQRLSQNIGNESHVLDLEKDKADKIANISGKNSVAFQREQSKLASLTTTFNEHQARISLLGNTYSRMSSQMAYGIDKQRAKIHDLDSESHNELQTAHSLTNVSIALGSGFLYGAKQAMGLQDEFNRVKNLLNTSGESFKQADGEIKQMGHDTARMSMQYGVSQNEISKGYEALVRRGYTGKQALASQKYYLQGTIASGDKYNDVMHTAASTLEAFNMRSNKTGTMVGNTKKVVNQLAYAADLTATDFKGIGYGMQYVGDTAHNAHQSLSETSSALGVLSNRGENATVAATGLRKILLALSTIKNSKNKGALSKIGLSPSDLQDSKGNLKSLSSVFEILNNHMKNMSSTQKATVFKSLFGTTGINSAFALSQSTGQLKSLNKQVAKSQDQSKGSGYAARIANHNMNSTQAQMARLKQTGVELAKTYAQGLNPEFKRLAGVGLKVANVLERLPKPVKDLVAVGTTIVPIIAGANYALSAFNKIHAMTISNSLKMLGISKNEQSQQEKEVETTDNKTKATNKDNASVLESIRLHKQKVAEEQQDSSAQDNDTKSDNENTVANKTNTTSVEANANADQTLVEKHSLLGKFDNATGGSIGTGLAGTALKNYGKAGAIGGALVGGSEIASGDTKGGIEDGLGTTAGTALGGVIAGPLGASIGSIAGPIAARGIGKSLYNSARSFNNWRQHNSGIRKNDDENHRIEQRVIHDQEQVQRIQQQNSSSFERDMKGMSQSSRSFVKSETGLQSKAERSYIENNNHLTKNAKNYYTQMYKMAQSYESKRLRDKKSELKALLKNHDISKKQYNSELGLQKSYAKKHLSQFRKDENAIMKDDTKNHKKRAKAIDKLNQQILSMTDKGTKKDKKLIADLDNRTTKLNKKSYEKTINAAMKNYTETVKTSNKTFSRKKREADREYNLAMKYARNNYKVHGRMYDQIQRRAERHKSRMIDNAKTQEQSTFKSATNQEKHVSDLAWKQASSATRSAEREKNNQTSIFSEMASSIGHFFKGLSSFHGSARHPGGNTARALGTPDTQALHLAVGNLPGISRDENAVINDGSGRELLKMPNGELVLPSGRNVHTILPKGTSVFNALQTRRLLTAINAISSPVQHHANGTVGEAGFAFGNDDKHGFNIGSMKGNVKDAKKAAQDIHDAVDKGYSDTTTDANKHLQDLHDNSDSLWDDTRKLTKKHVKNIHDDTSSRTKNLRDIVDKYEKQTESWSNSHLGTTVKYFRKHFNMIPPISRASMKAGAANVNAGIEAIDRVLNQFGGNAHVLNTVHYASGTSGPSMQKQIAMVNDATSGPTQEAIVSDNGKVRMPRGRNVLTALNPGDKVLNGSDTLKALRSGIIPHYANGKNSGEALYRLAEHYAKYPSNFINGTFNKFAILMGNTLSQGLTAVTKNGSQHPADNWSNALWKYINSIINPSTSALLKEAEKLGSAAKGYNEEGGKRLGPNYYDCSGLVYRALQHFGITPSGGSTSGPEIYDSGFESISRDDTRPGDLVGNGGHIGIVADKGGHRYYSAFSKSEGIRMTPLDREWFNSGPMNFRRVPQLAKMDENNSIESNPLIKSGLIQRELGSNAIHWIKSHINNVGAGMGNPAGDSVSRWIPVIKQAAKAMHVGLSGAGLSKVMTTIRHESQGDPTVTQHGYTDANTGGNEAVGLVQFAKSTFPTYSLAGHDNRKNGYDELLALFNDSNWFSDLMPSGGWNPSGHARYSKVPDGYATGGLSVSDKLAHISEGNKPEMVLPLTNRSRAVELMLKSLQYMFGKQSSNDNDNQTNANDQQFERELIQSNKNKDRMINKLLFQVTNLTQMSKQNINKMTVLINTVREKPVLSKSNIYKANRDVSMKKLRLRNLNRGTF